MESGFAPPAGDRTAAQVGGHPSPDFVSRSAVREGVRDGGAQRGLGPAAGAAPPPEPYFEDWRTAYAEDRNRGGQRGRIGWYALTG